MLQLACKKLLRGAIICKEASAALDEVWPSCASNTLECQVLVTHASSCDMRETGSGVHAMLCMNCLRAWVLRALSNAALVCHSGSKASGIDELPYALELEPLTRISGKLKMRSLSGNNPPWKVITRSAFMQWLHYPASCALTSL